VTNIEIALPSLEIQHEAVMKLSKIEEAMVECDRMLTVITSLVKSRFVEMFGDPVGNPMDWNVHKLGELGSLKNGLNFSAEETGYEIPCLGVADFADRFSIRGVDRLSVVGLAERPKSELFLRDGDIVFVRSNGNKKLVGRCLVVYPHDDELVFSGFCIRYRLESKILRVPFLVWTLKQASMRQRLVGRGSNVKNLNQKILSSLEVPVPPIELQDAFANFAAQVDKSRFGIQREGTSVLDLKVPAVWFGVDDVRGVELQSKC
jgi:type I restriction enzyme S subunit